MEGIDKNTFKQIFHDHWDAFKQFRQRFDSSDYNDTIQKMLDCGDPEKMALFNIDVATADKHGVLLSPANLAFAFPVLRSIPTAGQISSAGDSCLALLIDMLF